MRYFAKAVFALLLSIVAVAQTQNLQYYRISGITSAYPYVDNRSQATRYADYYGFCATGTGSWSVTIQYSDVSISGPWSNFSVGVLTVNNASTSCYGFASGYHAFLRFSVTGTASIDFTGSRGFYFPGQSGTSGGGGGGVNSVFGRTGAVVAASGDYTISQITNGVDATNAYPDPFFVASLAWSKITGVPSFQLLSAKGVADGYASLNGSALVPTSQLCTGSAGSGTYCDGGTRTWTTVPGSGGGSVASVFGRTGSVTAQSGDYNSDQITEGITNLFSTVSRTRNALSVSPPLAYNISIGQFSMPAATTSIDGYLSAANFVTFNSKESALTFTGALSRSVNTISCLVASGSQAGCLSSSDWTAFNSKEAALTFSSPLQRSGNTITLPSFPWASLTGVPSFAAIATSGSANDLIAGTVASARGGAGTINGIMKANGAGLTSAAVPGTDYMAVGPSGSQALDFSPIVDMGVGELTFTVTGVVAGERIAPGWPQTLPTGVTGMMFVSATNTVTVRIMNLSGASVDLGSLTYTAQAVR